MTPEIAKKLFKAYDDKVDITGAYIWEGTHAQHRLIKMEDNSNTYELAGCSEVEHSGDEEGICDQVRDLKNKPSQVIVEGKTYDVCIHEATCSISRGDRNGDCDYEVVARGIVTIKYLIH